MTFLILNWFSFIHCCRGNVRHVNLTSPLLQPPQSQISDHTLLTMAKSTSSKPSKPTSSTKKTTEQENFEKELQDLAAKAKEETFGKWALEQSWVVLLSATLLALAATSSTVSQLSLSPVYGSIPSSIYHDKTVVTALFLGWSMNLYLRRLLPVKLIYLDRKSVV